METPLLSGRYTGRAAAALLRNCGDEIGAMRGAQKTRRHHAAFLGRAACALTNGARTCARDVMKDAAEGTQTLPASPECDLGNGQIRIAQQCHGALDAAREQVAMRRNAEGLPERTREVRRRYATHPRKPLHRPVLVRLRIHAIPGAQQAAQQFRRRRGTCGFDHVAH
jgi:hypothetical protein